MEKLAKCPDYDIWKIVALSDKSTEQALLTIAEHVYRNLTLAQRIANNPNITIDVLKTFANAKDERIVSIGHRAIEMTSSIMQ